MSSRALILAVTLALLIGRTAGAADKGESLSPVAVYFPSEFGSIEEVYQGNSGDLVIYIQDAHVNEIAQRNIAKIIQSAHAQYGVDLIGVEGSSGPVDTSLFASFPGVKAKELVSQFLLRQGKISGAELANIQASGPFALYGVETEPLYMAHYESLLGSVSVRRDALAVHALLRGQLDVAKKKLCPPSLLEWERVWGLYLRGTSPVQSMWQSMEKRVAEAGVSHADLGHCLRYQELLQMQKSMDFKALDSERAEACAKLIGVMPRADAKAFARLALQFRMGHCAPLAFHERMTGLLDRHGLAYPRIRQYTSYLQMSEGFHRRELKAEMQQLSDRLSAAMAGGSDTPAMKVYLLSRLLERVEKFLKLEVSRADYTLYLQEKEAWDARALFAKVANLCHAADQPFTLATGRADALQQGLDSAATFYGIAIRRDGVLASNLAAEMARTGRKSAVLLAGGFHGDGILQYLKGRGVSYVTVLPKAGERVAPDKYMALLLRKETPYLDVYRKAQRSDVLSGSIGWRRVEEEDSNSKIAMAVPTFFMDRIRKFLDSKEDFRFEYVADLMSILAGYGEDISSWKKIVMLAKDSQKNMEFLEQVQDNTPMLRISDTEFYVPVKIGGAWYYYHFFSAEAQRDRYPADTFHQDLSLDTRFFIQVTDGKGFGAIPMKKFTSAHLASGSDMDLVFQSRRTFEGSL